LNLYYYVKHPIYCGLFSSQLLLQKKHRNMLTTTYLYTLLTFLLFLFTNEYGTVNCSVNKATFFSDLSLSGKICIDSEKYSEVSTRSNMYCARLCDRQTTCSSIFYSTITGICTLCSGNDNLQDQAGTLFYLKQSKTSISNLFHLFSKATLIDFVDANVIVKFY
jgi:hypothetical protein